MQQRNFINFYLILNISPKARTKDIKKAYLKLAQTYHPDKNRGNKLAEKKFQQINQAWQILKDAKKRELFDTNLEKIKKPQEQENFSKFKSFHQAAPKVVKKKEKAIDLEIPLKVSLEDICQSRSKTIHYFKFINGKKIKSSFIVQIPMGVKQGSRLHFKGKGGAEGEKKIGDLYIKILVKPHSIFQLTGVSDLLVDRPISFVEAIQGKKLDIPSPYGFLALDLNPSVTNKQLLKIKGYGLPKNSKGDKGDLFVKILIDYPTKNNIKIQKQVKSLSFDQQKVYVEKFKDPSFIYPKVLKFQKKMQDLKKK